MSIMRFDIITIFPRIFDSYFGESILKRAQASKKIEIVAHNLRDYTHDKHKSVDDTPYGGGAGMVLMVGPLVKAVEAVLKQSKLTRGGAAVDRKKEKVKIAILSAKGKQFNQKMAYDWAKKYDRIILVSGRYEGIDERVKTILRSEEISIGPYVLTGGEIPAMAVVDSVARHIPGVLGKAKSLEEKRYGVGVPAYTRPKIFIYKNKKYKVPEILLSGDHKKIENWRIKHKNA